MPSPEGHHIGKIECYLPEAGLVSDDNRIAIWEGVSPIFNTAGTSPAGEAFATGTMPGEGTFFCLVCGTQVPLHETDPLPACERCGPSRFRRDSIFSSLQEHGSPTVEFAISTDREPPP